MLVTGASRGIGATAADAFEGRGCTVGRVARTGELSADVADRESIAAAVERFGQVDVLVANAGIAHYLPFTEMPIELVEQLTQVNWLGTVYTVKAALPGMLERAARTRRSSSPRAPASAPSPAPPPTAPRSPPSAGSERRCATSSRAPGSA